MELDFNQDQLEELIESNYLTKTKHPFHNLFLLSYTKKTAKESKWNNITLNSRGIIIDDKTNIISRPFKKFFEISQLNNTVKIPYHLNYEIYEKLDGSLLISYWANDMPYLTTKGKFDSFQSIVANNLFQEKYRDIFPLLNKEYTYTFELISPKTRNIVNYYDTEDLFLINIIETKTGKAVDINVCNYFKKPKKYNLSIKECINDSNLIPEEGYVVHFENNFKLKIKKSRFKLSFENNIKLKKKILFAVCNSIEINSLTLNQKNSSSAKYLYEKATEILEYIVFYLEKKPQYKMLLIENFKDYYKDDVKLRFYILERLFLSSQYYSIESPYDISCLNT